MPAPSLQHRQPDEDIKEIEEVDLVAGEVLGERLGLVRVVVLQALVRVMQDPGVEECLRLPSRRPRSGDRYIGVIWIKSQSII